MRQLLDTKLNLTGTGEHEAGTIYVTNATSQHGTWNPFQSAPGAAWNLVSADKVPAGSTRPFLPRHRRRWNLHHHRPAAGRLRAVSHAREFIA